MAEVLSVVSCRRQGRPARTAGLAAAFRDRTPHRRADGSRSIPFDLLGLCRPCSRITSGSDARRLEGWGSDEILNPWTCPSACLLQPFRSPPHEIHESRNRRHHRSVAPYLRSYATGEVRSVLNRDCVRRNLGRLPGVGQQFFDPTGGMGRQSCQDILEVGKGLKAIELR